MDAYHKLLAGAILVLILALGIGAVFYVQSREDRIRAEERQKAADAQVDANNKSQAQRDAEEKQRESEDKIYHQQQDEKLADLAKTLAQLKTPQQQTQWSQQQLQDAIKGIKISIDPQTGAAQATIPKESVGDLPQVIEKCKECSVKLDTAEHNVVSRDQQIASLKTDLAGKDNSLQIMTKDRDDWKKTASGGSFFHRVKTVLRDAACAGGGAAIGAEASQMKPKGAAIGAVVAVVGCAVANR